MNEWHLQLNDNNVHEALVEHCTICMGHLKLGQGRSGVLSDNVLIDLGFTPPMDMEDPRSLLQVYRRGYGKDYPQGKFQYEGKYESHKLLHRNSESASLFTQGYTAECLSRILENSRKRRPSSNISSGRDSSKIQVQYGNLARTGEAAAIVIVTYFI